jgi:hypothetical protein
MDWEDNSERAEKVWWVYQGFDGAQLTISRDEGLQAATRLAGPFTWDEATRWMAENNNER